MWSFRSLARPGGVRFTIGYRDAPLPRLTHALGHISIESA